MARIVSTNVTVAIDPFVSPGGDTKRKRANARMSDGNDSMMSTALIVIRS